MPRVILSLCFVVTRMLRAAVLRRRVAQRALYAMRAMPLPLITLDYFLDAADAEFCR